MTSRQRLLPALTAFWLAVVLIAAVVLIGGADQISSALRLAVIALVVAVTGFVGTGWVLVVRDRRRSQQAEDQESDQDYTLEELLALSPSEFEEWVQRLFRSRGYFTHNTPNSGDHGVDLWVVSPQGERAIVQCKRYRGVVGESVVRDLYGVMQHEGAPRGFLVTTGGISEAAARWSLDKPIELIDGARLSLLAAGRVDPAEPLAGRQAVADG